jgi:hypothetical protein
VRHADLSGCEAADRVKKTLPPLTGVREDILKNCKTINKREAENFIE